MIAVRERNLNESGISGSDPLFEPGVAAHQLGTQRAAMEGILERNDVFLVGAVFFEGIGFG